MLLGEFAASPRCWARDRLGTWKKRWSSTWQKYWLVKSSWVQMMSAPFLAAASTRASCRAKFSWALSVQAIWVKPTLTVRLEAFLEADFEVFFGHWVRSDAPPEGRAPRVDNVRCAIGQGQAPRGSALTWAGARTRKVG
jgi:hypothetical protein